MYLALPVGHPLSHKPRVRLLDLAERDLDPGRRPAQRCAAACTRPPAGRPASSRAGRLPLGRLQRRPGAGRRRRGRLPAAEPGAREHARGHRRPLARQGRARRAGSRAATLAGRYRSPATEAMLEILHEVAADFELPSGAAVAAA